MLISITDEVDINPDHIVRTTTIDNNTIEIVLTQNRTTCINTSMANFRATINNGIIAFERDKAVIINRSIKPKPSKWDLQGDPT